MKPKTNSPLRNLRRARTLNQTDLARLVGVTQETISKAERGRLRLTVDVEARIATVLGVPRHDVFPASASPASPVMA
jgi:transcriptional regulator with XRE-family HTH domain